MSHSRGGSEVSAQKLRAIVEKYDDQPDQCTIFPSDQEGIEWVATWITAREGSFVDLQTVR